MKILMVNDLYELIGGTETYLLNLFEALEERGHTVVVLYGAEARLDSRTKNRPSYFVNFSQPIRVIINAIADIIKKESPDIIHIHNLGRAEGIYSYLSELCGLIPAVHFVHGHDLYCPSGRKYFYRGLRICQRRYGPYCLFSMLLNRCFDSKRTWIIFNFYNRPKQFLDNYYIFKKIIVSSEFVGRCLIKHGLQEESIEVLPYFTDIPELKDNDDKNIILFVGRIYKEKGLNYLIRALQFIKVPFKLVVVGDGDSRELKNCKKISQKLGLKDKVEFVGRKLNLQDYYSQASIVAVPSIWPEPFGIVGIEAMSYAKPVAAFNVGGIPEWLENNQTGFLVEPYNIKELASRIEFLLKDKVLAMQLGQEARRVVEEKFDKNRHIDRLLIIYKEVI